MVNVDRIRHRLRSCLLAGVMAFSFLSPLVLGATAQALHDRYRSLEPRLRATVFNAPIQLDAEDRDGIVSGEVYGILAQPFDVFRTTLQQPAAWCQLVILHGNIKACAHREQLGVKTLTLYTGKRKYENPKKARPTEFTFALKSSSSEYFEVVLTSPAGPLDTSDYRLEMQAVPLNGQTFAHVRFSYRYGALTRMVSSTYYSTLGRNRIGFSVVGTDRRGEPIHVKGRLGAIERNVMFAYLCTQAMFESMVQPEAQRFDWRLRRCYALTDKYARQLHEVEEDEYLQVKRRERADMLSAQHEVWPQKGN
jgi:hypothetical protein